MHDLFLNTVELAHTHLQTLTPTKSITLPSQRALENNSGTSTSVVHHAYKEKQHYPPAKQQFVLSCV